MSGLAITDGSRGSGTADAGLVRRRSCAGPARPRSNAQSFLTGAGWRAAAVPVAVRLPA